MFSKEAFFKTKMKQMPLVLILVFKNGDL